MKLKPAALAELALKQIDTLGYQLEKRGISHRVNRHNLIAMALVKQQKLKGEIARAELHWGLLKTQLKKLRSSTNLLVRHSAAKTAESKKNNGSRDQVAG